MNAFPFAVALGVFVGNWLVCPLILPNRSFTDGFAIGLIAAVLVLVIYGIAYLCGYRP